MKDLPKLQSVCQLCIDGHMGGLCLLHLCACAYVCPGCVRLYRPNALHPPVSVVIDVRRRQNKKVTSLQLRLHGLDPAVSEALTSPAKYDPYLSPSPARNRTPTPSSLGRPVALSSTAVTSTFQVCTLPLAVVCMFACMFVCLWMRVC